MPSKEWRLQKTMQSPTVDPFADPVLYITKSLELPLR
jgi:hypothetical protein